MGICNSNAYGIRPEDRPLTNHMWAKPVDIADQVFLGSKVVILKGVTIGDGSVIAVGSIVLNDVPQGL